MRSWSSLWPVLQLLVGLMESGGYASKVLCSQGWQVGGWKALVPSHVAFSRGLQECPHSMEANFSLSDWSKRKQKPQHPSDLRSHTPLFLYPIGFTGQPFLGGKGLTTQDINTRSQESLGVVLETGYHIWSILLLWIHLSNISPRLKYLKKSFIIILCFRFLFNF